MKIVNFIMITNKSHLFYFILNESFFKYDTIQKGIKINKRISTVSVKHFDKMHFY